MRYYEFMKEIIDDEYTNYDNIPKTIENIKDHDAIKVGAYKE